jgi:XTP/dITP diphosphohydrolase
MDKKMKNQILLATNNEHKIEEVKEWFHYQRISLEVVGLREVNIDVDVEENAPDFAGNAWLKVNAIRQKWSGDIIADDSGLCINALNFQPGVLSARFAGEHGNHGQNIAKVLFEMQNEFERSAYFITVLAGYWKGNPFTIEGKVFGKIARAPQGWAGFGYDPIFIPEGNSRSFAELHMDEKNLLSHRAKAFENWRTWIRENKL